MPFLGSLLLALVNGIPPLSGTRAGPPRASERTAGRLSEVGPRSSGWSTWRAGWPASGNLSSLETVRRLTGDARRDRGARAGDPHRVHLR
jgi:hypothetical protein